LRDRPIRVLVVDDDFRVAALHREYVTRLGGFEVVDSAHTASAALAAVRAGRPDLVLLDLYLPDENGLALLRRFREGDPPHPDVLAITAARDLATVRTAMQRGVIGYLVKPFPLRTLVDRLEAYRSLWLRGRAEGEVDQNSIDRLFASLTPPEQAAHLPKGHSEPTMALIRAEFGDADAEWSAAEVAERTGMSRATAQRYLSLLVRSGQLDVRLRYGTTGRPEHRYRRAR
jgi:response regulator of citrate/malate metabolism